MGRPAVKPRKLGANQLALVCDQCEGIVTRGSRFSEGYLTLVEVEGQDGIRRRQWQMFHDQCRPGFCCRERAAVNSGAGESN